MLVATARRGGVPPSRPGLDACAAGAILRRFHSDDPQRAQDRPNNVSERAAAAAEDAEGALARAALPGGCRRTRAGAHARGIVEEIRTEQTADSGSSSTREDNGGPREFG